MTPDIEHVGRIYPRTPATCERCGAAYMRKRAPICPPCSIKRQYRHSKSTGGAQAVAKVHAAIKAGQLPQPKGLRCADCGKAADRYDHRDYSQPLRVDPVCSSCNKKRGPALPVREDSHA